ncbi:MAG: hypothetical protein ACLQUZ_16910 [Rhizomicrobium sp.]
MNKLPVGKTVLGAYGFTFAHLGTIIGLIWAPLVASTLLSILPEIATNSGPADSVATGTVAIESLAVSLLTLLFTAIIYVGVTRQVLGLRQGPATFYFVLGQPEFRVFGARLLVVYVPALVYVACLLAAATIASAQGGAGPMAVVVLLLVFVGGPWIVYLIVRLSFLVTPVTVCENRIDIARGWALTRGNFWRIIAVLLAVGAPIFLLEFVGAWVLMGADLAAAVPVNGSHDPQAMQQYFAAVMGIIQRHTPALTGLGLILAPFSLGLSLSASALSYRELTASPPAA